MFTLEVFNSCIDVVICLGLMIKLLFFNPSKKIKHSINGALLALPLTWSLCVIILTYTNPAAMELLPFRIFAFLSFVVYALLCIYYIVHLVKWFQSRKLKAEIYRLRPENKQIDTPLKNTNAEIKNKHKGK